MKKALKRICKLQNRRARGLKFRSSPDELGEDLMEDLVWGSFEPLSPELLTLLDRLAS